MDYSYCPGCKKPGKVLTELKENGDYNMNTN